MSNSVVEARNGRHVRGGDDWVVRLIQMPQVFVGGWSKRVDEATIGMVDCVTVLRGWCNVTAGEDGVRGCVDCRGKGGGGEGIVRVSFVRDDVDMSCLTRGEGLNCRCGGGPDGAIGVISRCEMVREACGNCFGDSGGIKVVLCRRRGGSECNRFP